MFLKVLKKIMKITKVWSEYLEDPLWKSSLVITLQAASLQHYQKWNFHTCTFQGFCQLFKRTYFKECILMATFTIYFYEVYSFWIQWFVLCVIDFIETEFLKFYFIKDIFLKQFLNFWKCYYGHITYYS